jgi:hypothetical protein
MADERGSGRGPPNGRARPNDPLMREVRWRLFRHEDMPARLRRLQRLEDAAFPEPAPEAETGPGEEAQAGG